MTTTTDRSAGDARGDVGIEQVVRSHRRELLVHCYRMLGGLEDAEDAVQETLLKAWRRLDTFEGRSSVRAWLYRIATNVCLDALDRRARRILPTAITGAADPSAAPAPDDLDTPWLQPIPDALLDVSDDAADPSTVVVALVPTAANRQPALAVYAPGHTPFAVKVFTVDGPHISAITGFVSAGVLESFGLGGPHP